MDAPDAQKHFLVTCSESLILEHGQGGEEEDKMADIQHIVMVKLGSRMLKNLEKLECCRLLRICVLANNFITRIDALNECAHLVKLDLKGNQITQLPEATFWASLKELQLLNLHDNNMATRKNIEGLSSCPNLTALTLYDTPLSLKGNYRHCIVNSIWCLKALDNYVISDEEITEIWNLHPKFKPMNPHFFVNLYPTHNMGSFKSEMNVTHKIISDINRIQAIYSPTLIIQRWIRGHLTRKRLGYVSTWRGPRGRLSHIPSEGTSNERTAWSKETQGGCWVKKVDQPVQVLQEIASVASFDKKHKDQSPPYNTPQHSKFLKSCKTKKTHEWDRDLTVSGELYEEELERMSLFGFKAQFHLAEPVSDMLISRREGGQDIRKAITLFHRQRPEPPTLPHPRTPVITAEKRLIVRCHACISLAPLQVVERAYREREQAEALRKRAEEVTKSQAQRKAARDQRDSLMETRRKEVLKMRERERMELEGALGQLRSSQNREIQLARQRHTQFLEEKKRRAIDMAMVNTFSRQHASLAKAIIKRSIHQRLSVAQQERSDQVMCIKQQAKSQRKIIQGYKNYRQQYVKEEAIASCVTTDTSGEKVIISS